jgi:hypothetical protein
VDDRLILELLDGESRDVQDLRKNLDLTRHFLDLVTKIDSLPETNRRSFEESRSLYEAVSNGMDIDAMGKHLEGFFGPPLKPVGESIPLTLRFNSSAKYLGGIREDQTFFVKKLRFGEFYGALWPWQSSPGVMTVHLGFCCNKMADEDYSKLEKVLETALAEQTG